jgi:predicted nucleic acid-binding protein
VKIFLDTSSLIKLYFREEGTANLDKIFTENIVTEIFVSEITKTEFFSAIYKKLRTNELVLKNATDILGAFLADENKYNFILINSEIIKVSQTLIEKYGVAGLRSLDAIQLACACSIKGIIDIAITDDKLLNKFLMSERIKASV